MKSNWMGGGVLALGLVLGGCGGGGSSPAEASLAQLQEDPAAAADPAAPPAPAAPAPAPAAPADAAAVAPAPADPVAADPVAGVPTAPLAAPFDFAAATTDEARMLAMAREYQVAVTAAPAAADLGLGTLAVSYAGSDGAVAIELRGAAGARLWRLSVPALSDRSVADGRGINLWDAVVEAGHRPAFSGGAGRRLGVYNYFDGGNTNGPEAYAEVSFVGPGYVVGSIGPYRFRNSVAYVGTAPPAALASLEGTWAASAEAATCAPNPIAVTVAADGVRVQGKSSVSCEVQDLQVRWDGQDDFIFTDAAGAVSLVLDETRIGGSRPGGGLFITLPSVAGPATFGPLSTNFGGAAGGITALNPVRQ